MSEPVRGGKEGRSGRRRGWRPSLESLEGRVVLSVGVMGPVSRPSVSVAALGQDLNGAGVRAILNAMQGGEGNEWFRLVMPQVPSYGAVITGFQLGLINQFAVKGAVVKTPKLLSSYNGAPWDQLNAQAAGAVLLSNRRMELAAVLRGPIDAPTRSVYVFGLDRGGATTAPIPGLPRLRFDAQVTVVREASGALSGTVRDLKSGVTTAIAPRDILIKGSTLRVFVDPSRLPSTGKPLQNYRFGFVVRTAVDGGVGTVASAVSTAGTTVVGDLRARLR